jgi:hypothetical protein
VLNSFRWGGFFFDEYKDLGDMLFSPIHITRIHGKEFNRRSVRVRDVLVVRGNVILAETNEMPGLIIPSL